MRTLFQLIIVVLLVSCSKRPEEHKIIERQEIKKQTPASGQTAQHSFDTTTTTITINSYPINISTIGIDDERVKISAIKNTETILLDTIDGAGLTNIEFQDINNDGNLDIKLSFVGNNPINLIYLFDSSDNEFKYIEGFDNFPDAKLLKLNTKYYYSYNRAGCAD